MAVIKADKIRHCREVGCATGERTLGEGEDGEVLGRPEGQEAGKEEEENERAGRAGDGVGFVSSRTKGRERHGGEGGAPGRSKQGTLSHTHTVHRSQSVPVWSPSRNKSPQSLRQPTRFGPRAGMECSHQEPDRSIQLEGSSQVSHRLPGCAVGRRLRRWWRMRLANYCRAGGMCESKSKRAAHHPVSGLLSAGGAEGKTW